MWRWAPGSPSIRVPTLPSAVGFISRAESFPRALAEPFTGFSTLIQWASRCLGVLLLAAIVVAWRHRRPISGISARAWLFLLLGLILLPGILTTALKNHWGRVRPFQTAELGGQAGLPPP